MAPPPIQRDDKAKMGDWQVVQSNGLAYKMPSMDAAMKFAAMQVREAGGEWLVVKVWEVFRRPSRPKRLSPG